MEGLMRVVLAALMVVLLAIPAHARGKQRPGAEPQQAADRQKSSREEERSQGRARSNPQSEAGGSLEQDAIADCKL